MSTPFFLVASCLLIITPVFGQISFIDKTDLLSNTIITSGAPICVQDVNGDLRDDIIRLDDAISMTIDYQNADGSFTESYHGSVNGKAWGMAIGDITNSGYNEMIVGGSYNGVKLIASNGDSIYSNTLLDGPNIFVQGINFADIDNDGWLDAFSCHDDGPNSTWVNDGAGNLSHTTTLIDFDLFPVTSDNAGNYGSVWTDFDSDGDIDLYISKCRLGSSYGDVRRINQLWENDGSGNYTENAAAYGLDDGWQSWVSEFQDIDNDGDLDVFIGNHDNDSFLYRNDDGVYVDISAGSGVDQLTGGSLIQVTMKDFDNDGFVDLLASEHLYLNNGDNTFTEQTTSLADFHSFGIGDLNHDGFLDIYAGYANGYNNPSLTPDVLWMNQGNENNFLRVNLEGVASNRSAVGAKLYLHGVWGTMTREVRAGESYGITNSLYQNFGLGLETEIDSLEIHWPSGNIEIFDDISPNQFINIKEQDCISPNIVLQTTDALPLCTGESLGIGVENQTFTTYTWNQGSIGVPSISVNTEGAYNVSVTDASSCVGVSQSVNVTFDDANCNNTCSTYLNLFGAHKSDSYHVTNTLKSNGLVRGARIVNFTSEEYVLLDVGFEVEINGELFVAIDTCPNN